MHKMGIIGGAFILGAVLCSLLVVLADGEDPQQAAVSRSERDDNGVPGFAGAGEVTRSASAVTIGVSAYPLSFTPEEATSQSDAVVEGVVLEVGNARWTTADGQAPAGWKPGVPLKGHLIYRTARVQVTLVLTGEDVPLLMEVTVPGGSVGEVTMAVTDLGPQLKEGASVALFVVRPGDREKTYAPENWTAIESFALFGDTAVNEEGITIAQADLASRVLQQAAGQP